MKGGGSAAIICVFATVVCALAFVLIADDGSDVESGSEPPVLYKVEYGIDSSMMPSNHLTEYQQGAYVPLPIPVSDEGSFFCGWYVDPDLTSPLGAITPGTRGDLKLYPMWDDDPFGKVFTFNAKNLKSGWFNNKIIEYTFKITYGQCSNGMRPVGLSIDEVVNGFQAVNENNTYWLNDFYGYARYYGNIVEHGREMAVWTMDNFALAFFDGYPAILHFSDIKCNEVIESMAEMHSIEYVYDESMIQLSGYTPSMYCEGLYTELPSVKSNYFFEGWFEDETTGTPIGAVLPDRTEDLRLFPGVIDSINGRGFRMEMVTHFSYVDGNGTLNPMMLMDYNISGTSEWVYVTYNDPLYYIVNTLDLKCSMSMTRFGSVSTVDWTTVDSDGYWSQPLCMMDVDKTYLGNEVHDGRQCTVWAISNDDCYITVSLYRNFLPYSICYDYGKYSVDFKFIEETTYDGSIEFHPKVIAGKGLTIEGVDVVNIGDSLTLTASGDGFVGWYEDGEFITDSMVMTIERATPNTIYEARVSASPYILDKGADLHVPELHGTEYTIYDVGWNIVSKDSISDGTYCIVDGCMPYSHCIYITTGYKTVTFEWMYGGRQYSMNVDISQADVDRTIAYDDGVRDVYSSLQYVDKYFTTGDAVVREIASNLASYRDSLKLSDAQFAQFVLNFVQNMNYMTDSESHGVDEFFKYPIEFIWDGGGDCEDSSILYSTLMKVLGYKVGIAIFKDHCMSIVCADGVVGTSESMFVDKDSDYYYLCETSSPGWAVGRTPDHLKYTNETATYVYYVN